jgi:SRSO17 transposase
MQGMLSGLDRKNCWATAEHRGHTSPDRLQHLLSRARWDADAVRDDLRGYVVDHCADRDAILVLDETGPCRRVRTALGCSGSTPAPRAGSRTPRSRST